MNGIEKGMRMDNMLGKYINKWITYFCTFSGRTDAFTHTHTQNEKNEKNDILFYSLLPRYIFISFTSIILLSFSISIHMSYASSSVATAFTVSHPLVFIFIIWNSVSFFFYSFCFLLSCAFSTYMDGIVNWSVKPKSKTESNSNDNFSRKKWILK